MQGDPVAPFRHHRNVLSQISGLFHTIVFGLVFSVPTAIGFLRAVSELGAEKAGATLLDNHYFGTRCTGS